MRRLHFTIPEAVFVVATRAALAAGVGLLVSEKLKLRPRRALGWTLVALGAASTIPAAMIVHGNLQKERAEELPTEPLPETPERTAPQPLQQTASGLEEESARARRRSRV